MLATQVWTLREIQFPWFWGNCDFFGCARALGFGGAFAGALVVVEVVTLFVDMIDNVYNHREESKFRNGDGEHSESVYGLRVWGWLRQWQRQRCSHSGSGGVIRRFLWKKERKDRFSKNFFSGWNIWHITCPKFPRHSKESWELEARGRREIVRHRVVVVPASLLSKCFQFDR